MPSYNRDRIVRAYYNRDTIRPAVEPIREDVKTQFSSEFPSTLQKLLESPTLTLSPPLIKSPTLESVKKHNKRRSFASAINSLNESCNHSCNVIAKSLKSPNFRTSPSLDDRSSPNVYDNLRSSPNFDESLPLTGTSIEGKLIDGKLIRTSTVSTSARSSSSTVASSSDSLTSMAETSNGVTGEQKTETTTQARNGPATQQNAATSITTRATVGGIQLPSPPQQNAATVQPHASGPPLERSGSGASSATPLEKSGTGISPLSSSGLLGRSESGLTDRPFGSARDKLDYLDKRTYSGKLQSRPSYNAIYDPFGSSSGPVKSSPIDRSGGGVAALASQANMVQNLALQNGGHGFTAGGIQGYYRRPSTSDIMSGGGNSARSQFGSARSLGSGELQITPSARSQSDYITPPESSRSSLSNRSSPKSYAARMQSLSSIPDPETEQIFLDLKSVFSHARHGHAKIVERALQNGYDSNATDQFGNSLFHIACQNGNKKIAKMAIKFGGDMDLQNMKGNTGLHFLYAYGYTEIAEYFISKGANPTVKNIYSLTCRQGLKA